MLKPPTTILTGDDKYDEDASYVTGHRIYPDQTIPYPIHTIGRYIPRGYSLVGGILRPVTPTGHTIEPHRS